MHAGKAIRIPVAAGLALAASVCLAQSTGLGGGSPLGAGAGASGSPTRQSGAVGGVATPGAVPGTATSGGIGNPLGSTGASGIVGSPGVVASPGTVTTPGAAGGVRIEAPTTGATPSVQPLNSGLNSGAGIAAPSAPTLNGGAATSGSAGSLRY